MFHEVEANPELITREDLFIIIAVITTRLGMKNLNKHLTIPVRQVANLHAIELSLMVSFGLLGPIVLIHGGQTGENSPGSL